MIFGGDRVAGLIMPSAWRRHAIESGMLTRSLEGAQKVEIYHYDIRKQVFEYDEMNNQRRAVYSERRRC